MEMIGISVFFAGKNMFRQKNTDLPVFQTPNLTK